MRRPWRQRHRAQLDALNTLKDAAKRHAADTARGCFEEALAEAAIDYALAVMDLARVKGPDDGR